MRLETPRLIIRSHEPADASGVLEVFSHPEVRRYLPPFPASTLETLQGSIARRIAMEQERVAHTIAICVAENIASWQVMEKAGMRYVGTADYRCLIGLKKYVANRATLTAP